MVNGTSLHLQLEQSFLEAYILHKIQVTPMSLRTGPRQPTLQDIYLALQTDSPMLRKRAIIVYKLSKNISDVNDPSYQEAAKTFYRSREDYLETIRLLELGVLDVSMTNLDRKKRSQEPKITGTMTIADDLFHALDSDDPHLKVCANDYYSVLIAGTSLRDPKFNLVCRKFKVALENHNAKLRAQLEELQATKGQSQSLIKQLHDSEDNQASLSSKIKISPWSLIRYQQERLMRASQRSNPRVTCGNSQRPPQVSLPTPQSTSQRIIQIRMCQLLLAAQWKTLAQRKSSILIILMPLSRVKVTAL